MALHHAGFAVPPVLPPERWALTPPFHPYLASSPATSHSREPQSDLLKVFPPAGHRGESHRRFIFCGTLRDRIIEARLRLPQSRPPGVTRRVALQSRAFYARDFIPRRFRRRLRCPDFPPGQPSCEGQPSDHPACPPLGIIACTERFGHKRWGQHGSKRSSERRSKHSVSSR